MTIRLLLFCVSIGFIVCEWLCIMLCTTSKVNGSPQSLVSLFLGYWAEKFGNHWTREQSLHSTQLVKMTDWWSAVTDTYPPFTPINCRFFLVEGDPGSPSAFRFIIDLRDV